MRNPFDACMTESLVGDYLNSSRCERGGHPVSRRVGVGDFLATIDHMGIDAERACLRDPAGRPVPLLQQGGPIRELLEQGNEPGLFEMMISRQRIHDRFPLHYY